MGYHFPFHKILLFIAIMVIQGTVVAQTDSTIVKATHFELLADSSFNKSNFTAASEFYSKAAQAFLAGKDYEGYVRNLNYLSYIYYNVTKNIVLYNKYTLEAYEIAEKHLDHSSNQYIWALQGLSTYYYSLADYKKSIDLGQKAFEAKSKAAHDELDLANLSNGLGNRYKFLGDKENALRYFQKAISLINKKASSQQVPDNNITKQYLATYENIAIYFENLEQIDSAYYYINLAKPHLEQLSENLPKANHYLISSNIFSLKGEHTRALKEIDKALAYIGDSEYHKVGYLESKARLRERNHDYSSALELLKEAHLLAANTNRRNTASLKSKRLKKMYTSALEQGDKRLSLAYLDEGIETNLAEQFRQEASHKLEAGNFLNKLEALYFTTEKAKFHYEEFENSNLDQALLDAFEYFEISENLIRNIRNDLNAKTSKTELAQQTKDVIEGAIQSAYQLYNKTGNTNYVDKAFQFSEKNKALELLEKISNERAIGITALPDSLVKKESHLSLRISQLEKIKLQNALQDTLPKQIVSELDELYIEKNQLVNKLERNYPAYYNIKYNEQVLNIQDLQATLNKNQAILEFYEGRKTIYLLAISKDYKNIFPISKSDNYSIAFDSLSVIISRPPKSKLARQEYKQFISYSKLLYDTLLREALSALGPQITSLSITADGNLNVLPFEILLEDHSSQVGYNLSSIEYLIEKYTINYQYSLTHSSSVTNDQEINYGTDFLGFAPTFDNNSQGLTRNCEEHQLENLLCNDQELLSIAPIFDHKVFIGKEATVEQFNRYASEARIVHLATHTCLNPVHSVLNKLYLSDGDFSMLDLNNLKINAELAVLSACNSGIGDFIAGDGTLMSLWSIDDCATSDFMKIYYNKLKASQPKDIALQNAKLEFIRTAPTEKQHPFYWASFIAYGNMQALEFSNKNFYTLGGSIIGLLGLLWLLARVYVSKKDRAS